MSEPLVLQKLLTANLAAAIVEHGLDHHDEPRCFYSPMTQPTLNESLRNL
ncbi:hypothetical protein [Mycolicibacterium litorale]|uniref:Uncharacterized protein n=1 Tax=Mycolicibacterium litorale TaxID=758802 RepID=A0AAD1IK36_9MYCO|nr:hypothetical protein [Mycolicibacterium litorale]MCV7416013.1 hypothetical protein [Mycolicibacterium litorale]TDY09264.1 hypothetical protein BCL50_1354 [Mycolicibacterium litorale]BBY17207.1 hypothetical protein MLIT_27990 [Mycolicibacterium litorale]